MKRLLAVFSFVFILAMGVSAQTPIGLQKWQIDDTTFTMRFGGAPQNYPDTAGVFHEIENDFDVNMESLNRLLQTSVDSVGNVSVSYKNHTVTQEPNRLIYYKRSTTEWFNIDNSPNYNNISMDSNIVSWGNMYPGVDYSVILSNGRVENRYEFKPNFLDSMVTLYNQRADSLDIYLANVMKFTLTSGIDDDTISLGNVRRRVLKRFGGLVFQVGKTRLRGFPGADTLEVPVWQRYIFVGSQLYVLEFVKASDLKWIHELYPTATLWHNLDFTLDNDTDIEDARLTGNNTNANEGSNMALVTYQASSFNWPFLVKALNVNDSIGAGATFSYVAESLYCYSHTSNAPIEAYGMWNPSWVENDTGSSEGGVTYNDWSSPDDEWITEGVLCANDDGSFNTTDDGACNLGSGRDRMATLADNPTVTGVGWYGFVITSWGQTAYDAEVPISVRHQKEGANDATSFRSRESGVGNKPFYVFTYTVAGAPAVNYKRRRIGSN